MSTGLSFEQAQKAGLNSSSFSLSQNLKNGDRRLFTEKANDIEKTMQRDGVGFDEARLREVRAEMARFGIGPDGTPMDPKTFTFDMLPVRRPARQPKATMIGAAKEDDLEASGPSLVEAGKAELRDTLTRVARRWAWVRQVVQVLSPWPVDHFMSIVQVSSIIAFVLFFLMLFRFLASRHWMGLSTLQRVFKQGDDSVPDLHSASD
mmetsp:Transcript_45586/g.105759  ORF Transcript_45586/g.105759 Transcript_45586/m.105759 type:complete len:206 (-) Transcript_45586:90-707(-)